MNYFMNVFLEWIHRKWCRNIWERFGHNGRSRSMTSVCRPNFMLKTQPPPPTTQTLLGPLNSLAWLGWDHQGLTSPERAGSLVFLKLREKCANLNHPSNVIAHNHTRTNAVCISWHKGLLPPPSQVSSGRAGFSYNFGEGRWGGREALR